MRTSSAFVALGAVLMFGAWARAGEVYIQPHDETGLLLSSTRLAAIDRGETYSYDDFTLRETRQIDEIQWKGGYLGDSGSAVVMFRISLHASNPEGVPLTGDVRARDQALARYEIRGNADETYAGSYDGIGIYRYHFALPRPFIAQAGRTYWLCIQAVQDRALDWGLAGGTGGDDRHFVVSPNGAGMDRNDLSFALLATWTDLGFAHEGSRGRPLLSGHGVLEIDRSVTLNLEFARPESLALLFIGTRTVSMPFKGGTLVPDPMVVVPLATDHAGRLELSVILRDEVVAGMNVFLQYWILDPAASEGASASNALQGTAS